MRWVGWGIVVIGLALTMVALWGGSYVLHQVPPEDWRSFPIFVSFFGLGFLGCLLCSLGARKASSHG
jgi:hypothetical protein